MSAKRRAGGKKAQSSGKAWEAAIAAQNMAYALQNTALISHVEVGSRIVGGGKILRLQSPPDFDGSVKIDGQFWPVRWEAKSYDGKRWNFAEFKPGVKHSKAHQITALRQTRRFGGLAFVLVRRSSLGAITTTPVEFGYMTWLVPLAVVEAWMANGQWSATPAELDSLARPMRGADWMPEIVKLVSKEEK